MKAGEDDESSESFDTDFAEVIIELNEIPSNEVEVFFKISDKPMPMKLYLKVKVKTI